MRRATILLRTHMQSCQIMMSEGQNCLIRCCQGYDTYFKLHGDATMKYLLGRTIGQRSKLLAGSSTTPKPQSHHTSIRPRSYPICGTFPMPPTTWLSTVLVNYRGCSPYLLRPRRLRRHPKRASLSLFECIRSAHALPSHTSHG